MPYFSIIVPVYNRPDEIRDLLNSLTVQTLKDFELILIEDGSTNKCDTIAEMFKSEIDLKYFFKENTGRSDTRNYGMERASGKYLVFFDSDCIIPKDYFKIIYKSLNEKYVDSYGGPDACDDSFSDIQKAISFSMTSFLTTGGIRGRKTGLEKFTPRTFNMGISMEAYKEVGGFKDMLGEDIDMSLRIREAGYSSKLIPEAFVYHKRRVNFAAFFRQVRVFGKARIELYITHPNSLKAVHFLPAIFTLGSAFLVISSFWCKWALTPLLLFAILIFIESFIKSRNVKVALISIISSFIQLYGYGWGFIKSFIKKIIFRMDNNAESKLYRDYKGE